MTISTAALPANDLDALIAGLPLPLRLMPLPDPSDWMARAAAVRHNNDLIDLACQRETDAPIERIVQIDDHGYLGYAPVEPNACRFCDVPEREHGQKWIRLVGDHGWVPPTDRMRLTRMKGRRVLRLQAAALKAGTVR